MPSSQLKFVLGLAHAVHVPSCQNLYESREKVSNDNANSQAESKFIMHKLTCRLMTLCHKLAVPILIKVVSQLLHD